MEVIIWSFAIIGGLGLIFGVGLGIAAKKFEVEVDPRVTAVREFLPGANCGGCGFPGCDGLAAAIVAGEAEPDACAPCSAENKQEIGKIMGKTVDLSGRKVARLLCMGDLDKCQNKSNYIGIHDCKAAALVAGGFKSCKNGCLGLGTCQKVCPFGAISIGENGISHVDEEKCTGCGKCVAACPEMGLILMPAAITTYVACRNHHMGKSVMSECKAGCIGCNKCAKTCPFGAIEMVDHLPVIDYEKCRQCQACADACPRHIIQKSGVTKKAVIDTDKCVGCTLCKKVCPFDAIDGEPKQDHVVNDKCRGCGACADKCKLKAITIV